MAAPKSMGSLSQSLAVEGVPSRSAITLSSPACATGESSAAFLSSGNLLGAGDWACTAMAARKAAAAKAIRQGFMANCRELAELLAEAADAQREKHEAAERQSDDP